MQRTRHAQLAFADGAETGEFDQIRLLADAAEELASFPSGDHRRPLRLMLIDRPPPPARRDVAQLFNPPNQRLDPLTQELRKPCSEVRRRTLRPFPSAAMRFAGFRTRRTRV